MCDVIYFMFYLLGSFLPHRNSTIRGQETDQFDLRFKVISHPPQPVWSIVGEDYACPLLPTISIRRPH